MATKTSPYEKLNIDIIQVSDTNPRLSAYEGEAFDTLVDTIKEHGVITPLTVNNIGDEYILISGERRCRAAKKAGLEYIPCIVHHNLSAEKILKMQVIENTGRVSLSSIEEGLAIKNYINKYPETKKKDVAEAFGIERTRTHKALKIIELPETVWGFISNRKLSDGHAEAITRLIGKVDEANIIEIATAAISLTVSETRELVSDTLAPKDNTLAVKLDKVADRIAAHFGGTATVKRKGKDKVALSVELNNGSIISVTSNTDEIGTTLDMLGVVDTDDNSDLLVDLSDTLDAILSEPIDADTSNTDQIVPVRTVEEKAEVKDDNKVVEAQVSREEVIEYSKPITKIELPVVLPPDSENNVCVVIDPIRGDQKSNMSLMRSLEKLCPSKENLTSKHNVALLVLITEANKLTKKGYCDAVTADSIISKLCANHDFVSVYRNYGTSEVYELKVK